MGKHKRRPRSSGDTVTVLVPTWVPDGHPHQWSANDTAIYELNTDAMNGERYRLLDDEVYGERVCTGERCDDPTCPFRAAGGEWHAPTFDPTKPFVVENFMPPGDPADWSMEMWQEFADVADSLPVELGNELDDLAWTRMDAMGSTSPVDAAARTWQAMTDKELEELHAALEADESAVVNMGSEDLPKEGKRKCDCGGPSKDSVGGTDKYGYHLRSCKAYNGTNGSFEHKGGLGVTKPKCICSGPSNDGSGGSGQFNTHTGTCPWSKSYKAGAVSTPYKSTYVATPTCTHDREGKQLALENGLLIRGVAYRNNKYRDHEETNVGVYMYSSWQPDVLVTDSLDVPWASPTFTQGVYIDWPDMGVPRDTTPMVEIVQWMLEQLAAGVTFETGCMGGHGRTGTMMACLLVAQGVLPGEAIVRVRKDYCDKAIETEKQGRYIGEFYKLVHGNAAWKKSAKARKQFEKAVMDGHKNYSSSSSAFSGGYYSGRVWDADTKKWVTKAAGGNTTPVVVPIVPKPDGYDEASQTYTKDGTSWTRPQPFQDTETGVMVVWCRAAGERLPFQDVWWDKVDGTYRATTYVPPTKVAPETQQTEVNTNGTDPT